MRLIRLAILSAAFLASAPAFAARCGGDFNSFVRNISAEGSIPVQVQPSASSRATL